MEITNPGQVLIGVSRILDKLNIPYLVTGGVAVLLWGRPRFTADIDLVVELPAKKADALKIALLELSKGGYVDKEAVLDAIQHKGEFNFIDGETGMKVDFWISKEDAFNKSRMDRRIPKTIMERIIFFSSPEDLIISKLQWYAKSRSSRHTEDIQSILSVSGNILDRQYIKLWVEKLSLTDEAREINL
jgi:hypothetical protein